MEKLDIIIFIVYGVIIIAVGNWLARSKGKKQNSIVIRCVLLLNAL